MEDLVPLLIFVVIVAVNLFKFLAEKGGKAKQTPGKPSGTPPRRQPSALEQFFENLAEQVAPQPSKIPDWTEGYERSDYVQEMEAFEEDQTAEIIPMPPPFQPLAKPAIVQGVRRAGQSALSGSHGLRMPGNTFISTGKAGRAGFRIDGKNDLKQALIGQIIFSLPRAYDLSFDNTLSKRG
jgi:hypothetical protein